MLLTEENFVATLKSLNIQRDSKIAVACSGGADSLALTLLTHSWADPKKSKVVALTVDHGLRKESAKEAKQVGQWLKKYGISHTVLKWESKKPKSNIQEKAREARYLLFAAYCKAHGISHLLVAHTREDQAETFLLRLARGSGVDGLAGMAKISTLYGLTIVRPLLDVPKAELVSYLGSRKQPYVNDPGNENPAYDRIKMRKLLPTLSAVGISIERLTKTASAMARARACLEEITTDFMAQACAAFPEGYVLVHHLNAPEEIALRTLATLVMMTGGHTVRPRLNDLERLYDALKNPAFKGATLGGCIFTPLKKGLLVCRELKSIAPPILVATGETVLWDNRFEITRAEGQGACYVGALTQEGWLSIAGPYNLTNPYPDKRILYSLPALRDEKGKILAVPHLKFISGDKPTPPRPSAKVYSFDRKSRR